MSAHGLEVGGVRVGGGYGGGVVGWYGCGGGVRKGRL